MARALRLVGVSGSFHDSHHEAPCNHPGIAIRLLPRLDEAVL